MIKEHELLSVERKSSRLVEIINPINLPEAGFQSYVELENNSADQKRIFLTDEIRNPIFIYPNFKNPSKWDNGILILTEVIESVDYYEPNKIYADATKSSLDFRRAEMEYVKLLAKLDYSVADGAGSDTIIDIAERARCLNEHIYGLPKPEIVDAALNEMSANINSKSLSPSAQVIYDDLLHGFDWQGKNISPIIKPQDNTVRLPDYNDKSLVWAGEHIIEKNADVEALISEFWASKVEQYGNSYRCLPNDIATAFEQTLALLDPQNVSKVRIIKDSHAMALSWESSLMAVKVGMNRKAIESSDELFQKILHELVVHGGRAINGLKTDLPILGLGLFTDTIRPDYLTFEEGFANTVEDVVSGQEPKWDADNLSYYVNIALAKQGQDFRAIFEKTWRYSLLMGIGEEIEVSDNMIKEYKNKAYNNCVRIFRGNQTNLSEKVNIAPMTYNKDLAYLEGRTIAMQHIADLYELRDVEGLDRLFMAKYDPTNSVQDNIVKLALGSNQTKNSSVRG